MSIKPDDLHEALLWNQIRKGSVYGAPIDMDRFNELQQFSARNSPNIAASIAATMQASRIASMQASPTATPPDGSDPGMSISQRPSVIRADGSSG